MNKKFMIIFFVMLVLCLTGCKKSNLVILSDEKRVEIIAENASKKCLLPLQGSKSLKVKNYM